MNDLITKCVAKEAKLKKEKSDIAMLLVHDKPTFGEKLLVGPVGSSDLRIIKKGGLN